ncbi:helix-turn-helix domain-containing protein [Cohnella fermenti]|nr:helix-turn-helix domain-containing protein [Cohnella fermenti]
MKLRSRTYFTRLLIFSLLLGTIPVALVGMISYFKSSSIVQDKVNQSSMEALQQTQLRVEQMLKTIDHSVTQLISSPIVVSAMELPYSADYYRTYNELYQSMIRSQTFELTVSNMTVVNLIGGWGVDNNNIFTMSDLNDPDRLLHYESIPVFSAWVTDEENEPPSISLVKKIPLNSLKARGLAVVTVSEAELAKLLPSDLHLGSILILDGDNRLLTYGGNEPANEEDLLERLTGRPGGEGQFDMLVDGAKLSVIKRQSSYNGWTYLSIIPIKEMTRDSRSIGWVTLAVCFLMMLATAALALFGSRSFYQPVRRLVRAIGGPSGLSSDHTARDEFALIESRLQSMLQTESRLSAQVVGQARELKSFLVLKLLRGEEKEEGQLAQKLQEFGFPADWRWHAALAVQIDSLEGTRYSERDVDLLLFAVANIAGELIPAEERLDPVLMDQSSITLIGGTERTEPERRARLLNAAERIQESVRRYLDIPISIGISRSRPSLLAAPVSAEEALEALRYRIRIGPESVLFIEDVAPGEGTRSGFPHRTVKELCDAVRLTDGAQSRELLGQSIELIFREQADWRQYHLSLIRLYTMLTEIMQSDSAPSAEASSDPEKQLFQRLLELNSQEEIRQWFEETVLNPILSKLEQQRKSHAQLVAGQLAAMIHAGYDTEITLEACAAQLNYHPNHLGPLFGREMGISFSEYLQQYRLKIAKQWLVETDMRVGEIAERLTYTNSQNFIRFFRKAEDMTPGQYRERHRRD